MIVGAHVSTAGGWDKAVERSAAMGCNGIQIFTGSPRMWRYKEASEMDYEGWFAAREQHGVDHAVIHATYLLNLASDKPELVEKSREILINDMEICAKGKFEGVVVHLGSHQGRGYEVMRDQMVEELKKILDKSPDKGVFLIENSAGQKGKIASRLEEVAELIQIVDDKRLGWCFDTCHAHANGYLLGHDQRSKIKNKEENQKLEIGGQGGLFGSEDEGRAPLAVEEIEKLKLWETLKCVHVNESRDSFDSGRDRHANLGEGEIGSKVMREFVSHEQVKKLPLILEVPGFDGKGPDKKNVDILKKMVS